MCHASLKMALLLHTEGLVKTALASTVMKSMKILIKYRFLKGFCENNKYSPVRMRLDKGLFM